MMARVSHGKKRIYADLIRKIRFFPRHPRAIFSNLDNLAI